jgi:glycosyltransferase involved in cell wall biosynthesis
MHDKSKVDLITKESARECFVSIITPVFNGESFIADSIRRIIATVEQATSLFEVIVVCDGCSDGTAEAARSVDDSRVHVIEYGDNSGKGHAITCGLSVARGRLVGWLDADLDIDPEFIVRAMSCFSQSAVDAVIGSKRHPDSAVFYPLIRRIYSWGYQILVRILFRFTARDTQVGAKLFRHEMVDIIRPLLLVKRYAYDLEFLAVGAQFGFDRIEELPVELEYRFSGTKINWKAVYNMLTDTLAVAYRIHVKHYYVRQFAAVQRERMDHVKQSELSTR